MIQMFYRRCELGVFDTGSDIQNSIEQCPAPRSCRGARQELSTSDPGPLRTT